MPPPPPAPPPPPPPPPPTSSLPPKSNDRSKLLSEIQLGARLKKTVTNDRSAPLVGGGAVNSSKPSASSASSSDSSASRGPAAPAGLGALFANGVPRKPSDVKNKNFSSSAPPGSPTKKPVEVPVSKPSPPAPAAPSKPNVSESASPPRRLNSPPKVPKPPSTSDLKQTTPNGSSNGPPPPPAAKLKPTLPAAPPAVHKPTSQQPQFQTMRPGKVNGPAPPPFRRGGSTEDVRASPEAAPPPRIAPRPPRPSIAPPPPPPAQNKPHIPHAPERVERNEPPPPPPPPRTASYHPPTAHTTARSTGPVATNLPVHERFQFVPISDLPPPEPFSGFKKDYNFGPGGGRLAPLAPY